MRTFFLSLIIAIFACTSLSAQSLTLEGGAAAVPTHLPSWTLGGSLQIPVIAGFSVGASYYRWANNLNRQALIDKYPLRDPTSPSFIFPENSINNTFWGNNAFALYALYKPFETEKINIEVGIGWSFIEYVWLQSGIGIPDEGNNYQQNKLGFMNSPQVPSPQRLSGLLQTRFKLSNNFALQGKIAAFGTEHFVATLGISFMPWGSTSSLADLFAPQQK